ncbi:hypothetical protein Patl1_10200 [Pistacia atlantica]|uniref:Uncharacterized protein n=1 Tax=Pistacia atlantica TaxID=434234 RepID=A0ACC1A8A5_9ROSI|nr:hypothetical protein Patl1_10200 [Pistacia atlantica]
MENKRKVLNLQENKQQIKLTLFLTSLGILKLNQMNNLTELASLVQDCVNGLNETHSSMVSAFNFDILFTANNFDKIAMYKMI